MKKIISSSVILSAARMLLGFVFLWAFLDKTFGLGFATKSANAWIRGGSPTTGFLSNAVQGPFVDFFHKLSGLMIVDWLFMFGLLFVGVTLIMNRWVKWGSVVGIIMLLLMYFALLWPANNPFVDEHLIYAVMLIYIGMKSEAS
jgi:thiosulfate dehydrogenase [quinone] large subunit